MSVTPAVSRLAKSMDSSFEKPENQYRIDWGAKGNAKNAEVA